VIHVCFIGCESDEEGRLAGRCSLTLVAFSLICLVGAEERGELGAGQGRGEAGKAHHRRGVASHPSADEDKDYAIATY
jgi:hypothetical protein